MPGSKCLPIYIDSSITGYKQASLPNPCVMEAAAAPLLLGILLLSLSPSPLTARCPNTCGNLTIPYPFGIGSGCYLAEDSNMFPVDCDYEANPPVAYWRNRSTRLHITDFSVADHEFKLRGGVAYDCNDASGSAELRLIGRRLSRFPISRTKNMFTAIGCDTVARFVGTVNNTFDKTCTARCDNTMANTTWSGFGYCQMSVPWDCTEYNISITNNNSDLNSCSYGFVAEKGYFNFSAEYLLKSMTGRTTTPVIVEWSIPGKECDEAQQDNAPFACRGNTTCTDVMSGYQCQCKEGYRGNPYLSGENGCQDIDECITSNPCIVTRMCTNLPGSFNCSCPKGYLGDGLRNGTGCIPQLQSKSRAYIVLSKYLRL
ncbi:hypothetical protein SAY87_018652 [Trapa incisa]|uniref:EGF-like domain-containing protein n=1 Tax=Trapa incisa TaxID=236973 RepID=A0AAN7Q0L9_9MYRT|nr:hypothetical protein SAY87_018652 [Trapa incisa]